jgi:hypothetical protein
MKNDDVSCLGTISNFGKFIISEGELKSKRIFAPCNKTITVGDLVLTGDISQYTPRTKEFLAANNIVVEGSPEGVTFTTLADHKFLTVPEANKFVAQKKEQDEKTLAPKLMPNI